jgi:hypothetical protein
MSDLVKRLCRVGKERQNTTAHDDPTHYLHVVAKISNADGLLMLEAADEITRLIARVKELEGALAKADRYLALGSPGIAREITRAALDIAAFAAHSSPYISGKTLAFTGGLLDGYEASAQVVEHLARAALSQPAPTKGGE